MEEQIHSKCQSDSTESLISSTVVNQQQTRGSNTSKCLDDDSQNFVSDFSKAGKDTKDGGLSFLINTLSKAPKHKENNSRVKSSKRKRSEKPRMLLPKSNSRSKNIALPSKGIKLLEKESPTSLQDEDNISVLSDEEGRPFSKKIIELCDKIKHKYEELKNNDSLSPVDAPQNSRQNQMGVTELCDKIRSKYESIKRDEDSVEKSCNQNLALKESVEKMDDSPAKKLLLRNELATRGVHQQKFRDKKDGSSEQQCNVKDGSNIDCQSHVHHSISSPNEELDLHLDVSNDSTEDPPGIDDMTGDIQVNPLCNDAIAKSPRENSSKCIKENIKHAELMNIQLEGRGFDCVAKRMELECNDVANDASSADEVPEGYNDGSAPVAIAHEVNQHSSTVKGYAEPVRGKNGTTNLDSEANVLNSEISGYDPNSNVYHLVSCKSDELMAMSMGNLKCSNSSNDVVPSTVSFKVIGKLVPSQQENNSMPCKQLKDNQDFENVKTNGILSVGDNGNDTVVGGNSFSLQRDEVNKICYRIQTADSSKQLTNLVCLGETRRKGIQIATDTTTISNNCLQDVSIKEGAVIFAIPASNMLKGDNSLRCGRRTVTPILPKPSSSTTVEISNNHRPIPRKRKTARKQKQKNARDRISETSNQIDSIMIASNSNQLCDDVDEEQNNKEDDGNSDSVASNLEHGTEHDQHQEDFEIPAECDQSKYKLDKNMSKASIGSYIDNLISENESIALRNNVVHYRKQDKVQKSYKKVGDREIKLFLDYKQGADSKIDGNSKIAELQTDADQNDRTLTSIKEEALSDFTDSSNTIVLGTENFETLSYTEADAIDNELAKEIAWCVQRTVTDGKQYPASKAHLSAQCGVLSDFGILPKIRTSASVKKGTRRRTNSIGKKIAAEAILAKDYLPNHVRIMGESRKPRNVGLQTALVNVFQNGLLSFNSKGKLKCMKPSQENSRTDNERIKIIKFRNTDTKTCIRISDKAERGDGVIDNFAWKNLNVKNNIIGRKRNFEEAFPLDFDWEMPHYFSSRRLTHDRNSIVDKLQKYEIRMQRSKRKVSYRRDFLVSCVSKRNETAYITKPALGSNSMKRKYESNEKLKNKLNKVVVIKENVKDKQKRPGPKKRNNALSDAEVARLIALRNELGITNSVTTGLKTVASNHEDIEDCKNISTDKVDNERRTKISEKSKLSLKSQGIENGKEKEFSFKRVKIISGSRNSHNQSKEDFKANASQESHVEFSAGCKKSKLSKSVNGNKVVKLKVSSKSAMESKASRLSDQRNSDTNVLDLGRTKTEHRFESCRGTIESLGKTGQFASATVKMEPVEINDGMNGEMAYTSNIAVEHDGPRYDDTCKTEVNRVEQETLNLTAIPTTSTVEKVVITRSMNKLQKGYDTFRNHGIEKEACNANRNIHNITAEKAQFELEKTPSTNSERDGEFSVMVEKSPTIGDTALDNSFFRLDLVKKEPSEDFQIFVNKNRSNDIAQDESMRGNESHVCLESNQDSKPDISSERRRSTRLAAKISRTKNSVENLVKNELIIGNHQTCNHCEDQNCSCVFSSAKKNRTSSSNLSSCNICNQEHCKCLNNAKEAFNSSLSIYIQKCFDKYKENSSSSKSQSYCEKCGEIFSAGREFTKHFLYHMVDEAVEKQDMLKNFHADDNNMDSSLVANDDSAKFSKDQDRDIVIDNCEAEDKNFEIEGESTETKNFTKKKIIYKAQFWTQEKTADESTEDDSQTSSENWTPLKLGINIQPVRWKCLACNKVFQQFHQIKKHADKHNNKAVSS